MAALVTSALGGTVTAYTITLDALASSATAGRQSTRLTIDTATGPIAHQIQAKIVIGAGTPANDKRIYIYGWGSQDSGLYPADFGASDAAVTFLSPTELYLLHVIPIPNASKTYTPTFDTARIFPGGLPPYWGIAVKNYCGIAIGSGSTMTYQDRRLTTV